MFIEKLEIQGFKGYENKTTFAFNKRIEGIIGENGTGKTSIGDAIRWLLTGCDPNGNDKNNQMLLNKNSKKMNVAADIVNDKEMIKAERTYDGESAILTINGKKQSSKYFENYYKEKDYVMAMLDMEYIINLNNQKGRDFFMKILPPIEKEEIIKRMKKSDKLPKEEIDDTAIKALRSKISKFTSEEDNLKGRIAALKESIKEPGQEYEFQKQDKLEAYEKKLKGITKSLEKEMEMQKELNNKKTEALKLTQKRKTLLEKYNEKEIIIRSLKDNKCPTCKQVVKNAENQKKIYTEEKAAIIKEGKEVAANIEKLEKEFQKAEKDIADLKSLNNSMEIIETINKLKDEQQKVELSNTTRKTIIENNVKYSKNIEEYEKALDLIIRNKVNAENQIEALKEYNLVHTQMQIFKIQKYFNKVSINLFKINKETEEVKETYEVLYEGKEDKLLSRSERIKTGMEIAKMICLVTNTSIPIFIDNAESITKYNVPDNNQIFIAKVEADKEIQVYRNKKVA